MTTSLKYGVDIQGIANGLEIPVYNLLTPPYEIATYHLTAGSELEVEKPVNVSGNKSDDINRVVINSESPTLLSVNFIGGLSFPTVHGEAVQGMILNPGVLIMPDGINSIFLLSKIQQNVTVAFYSNAPR